MDDVRFGPHYVCLALNSGRKWVREFESGYDPKRPLPALGETHIAGLSSAVCHSVVGAISRIQIRSR